MEIDEYEFKLALCLGKSNKVENNIFGGGL